MNVGLELSVGARWAHQWLLDHCPDFKRVISGFVISVAFTIRLLEVFT